MYYSLYRCNRDTLSDDLILFLQNELLEVYSLSE